MYCRNCGREVKSGELFCKYCGEKLKNEKVKQSALNYSEGKSAKSRFKWYYIVIPIIVGLVIGIGIAIGVNWKELKEAYNPDGEWSAVHESDSQLVQVTETETQIRKDSIKDGYQGEKSDTSRVENESEKPKVKVISMKDIQSISASSHLKEKSINHIPERLVDEDTSTAWVEGVNGNGEGEYVFINLNDLYSVSGIKIWNGYQKSKDLYFKNARPAEIKLEFSDGTIEQLELQDEFGKGQTFHFETRITAYVKMTIISIYEGDKYEDTVISEVELF